MEENKEGQQPEEHKKESQQPEKRPLEEMETGMVQDDENKTSSDVPAVTEPEIPETDPRLERIADSVDKVRAEMGKVIIGQSEMIDLLIAALFTNGHVLMEGVPGIAKTLSARLMAKTMSVRFTRAQFTPDLMPSDIVGTNVYSVKTGEFSFKPGPVFTNVLLIDEINRAPAKTQAALFEVMEERQVTIDGHTHKMEFPFFTIATQNPIEQEGTYKLPEAQLDRFLFRVKLDYPSLEEEQQILYRFREQIDTLEKINDVQPVFQAEDIRECQSIVEEIHIKDDLLDYIAKIVNTTRNHADIFLGASPRASLAIMKTSKAIAAMNGRNFVTPDDIQYVAYPVLNHRIILTPEKELEGDSTEQVIESIIHQIDVPR